MEARKEDVTSAQLAEEDYFLELYLPFADEETRIQFRASMRALRKKNELNQTI